MVEVLPCRYLYCGSGKEILKYSLSAERLVKVLCGHEDAVTDLCLNSDGDLVSKSNRHKEPPIGIRNRLQLGWYYKNLEG